jgi:hypothetical protein
MERKGERHRINRKIDKQKNIKNKIIEEHEYNIEERK